MFGDLIYTNMYLSHALGLEVHFPVAKRHPPVDMWSCLVIAMAAIYICTDFVWLPMDIYLHNLHPLQKPLGFP